MKRSTQVRPAKKSALTHVRRALAATTRTAQALAQAASEKELVERVCAIVVDAGYRFCWVGLAEHDDNKTVRPLAWAGYEDGYLSISKFTWSDAANGRGPAGTSIRTAKPAVFHNVLKNQNLDPWRTEARRRGYRSICGLPLVVRGAVLGTLCIYAGQPAAFGAQEIELLVHVAEMLSFGLMNFRTSQRTREALREASELNKQVIDNSPGGIIVYNQDLRCELWNPYMENLTGVPAREILSKNPLDVFPVLRELRVEEGLRRALAGEANIGNDIPFTLPLTGKTLWLSGQYAPVRDAAGWVTKVVVTVRDVTEVKRAEEALRASEHRSQEATRVSRIGIFDHDHVTDTIYHSSVLREMYDIPPDVPITLPVVVQRIHPEDRERVREAVQRTLDPKNDSLFEPEFRIVRRDGSIRWMAARAQTTFEGEGSARHATRTIGTIFDVTKRKQMEEALAVSEQRLQEAARVSHIGIFDHDRITDAIYHSSVLREMFGYGPDEPVTMQGLLDRIHPEDREAVREAIRSAQDPMTDGSFKREYRVTRRDGSVRWLAASAQTVFEGAGKARRAIRTIGATIDVTERRQMEEALRQSERRLRQAARVSEMGIFDHDMIANTIYWSPEQRKNYGVELDKPVTLQMYLDGVFPEDREAMRQAVERAHDPAGDGLFDVEHRIVRRDGTVRWLSTRSETTFEGEGSARRPVRTTGAVIDITERRAAAEKISSSERQLRQILDTLFGFVGLFTLDGVMIEVNQVALDLGGLTREDVIGKPFWEAFWWENDPQQQALLRDFVARAAKGEMVAHCELRSRAKDGNLIDVDAAFAPLRGADQSVIGIVSFGVDVTEQRRAEARLRESEERLRQLAENVPEVFWMVDTGTKKVTYVSPAYESIWGRRGADLHRVSQDWMEAIHPEDRDRVGQAYAKGLSQGVFEQEYRIVRPDGEIRWVHDRGFPILDQHGKVYRQAGVATDITERKKIAEREAARRKRLEELAELSMMLSGDPAAVYERVVRMIGRLFDVRTVRLSEIQGRNLLFKAVYADGNFVADAGGCALDLTPCGTVEAARDIVVYDRVAERFPQASFLRDHNAYAFCGFPALDNEGRVIAITCLLDDKPHEFTGEDKNLLRIIGHRLAAEVERGKSLAQRARAEKELRENQRRLVEAQRIGHMGSWELNLVTGQLAWSEEIDRILELDPRHFGATHEVFLSAVHPEDREAVNAVYAESVATKAPYEITYRLRTKDGRVKWVQERGTTEYSAEGAPVRSTGTVQDITERKLAELRLAESLREKETLLREIHHRVKNNLQIISSLLHFQSKKVADGEAKAVFLEGQDRLRSMILVHDRLYRSQNLSAVDFGDYVNSLAQQLVRSNESASRNIRLTIEAANVSLPVETALPCGMIVSELLTNVFKYAFPDGNPGEALLRVTANDNRLVMMVQDNGVGFGDAGSAASTGFGLQLVYTLTEQLNGLIRIESSSGTCITVDIPIGRLVHAN